MLQKIKYYNYNIDLFKIIAIFSIVIYHISTVYNRAPSKPIINLLLNSGGFVGVTVFLFISGCNIYHLLDTHNYKYGEYIFGRWKKLSPHYYISLGVSLLFTFSACLLTLGGAMNIISHLFYFHNLFYSYHGSISGVCWTLGVIFQFYLIAPFIKKALDRFPKTTVALSLLCTLLFKAVLFLYIFPKNNANSFYYFIYGGQIFTSIDMFVIGMYIAKYHYNDKKNHNIINYILSATGFVVLVIYVLIIMGYKNINPNGIYTNNLISVFAFTVLTIIISLTFIFFNRIKISDFSCKIISKVNKNEYALYIWHLLILENVIKNSGLFSNLININPYLAIIICVIFIYIVSSIINTLVSYVNFEDLIGRLKNIIINKRILIYAFSIILLLYFMIPNVKSIFVNVKNYDLTSKPKDAYTIYENSVSKMEKGKNTTYLYIDEFKTGYLYFYKLRYYFIAEASSVDLINNYINELNSNDEKVFINYIKEKKPDYVIVRKNGLLESNGYKINHNTATVFRYDENSNDIKTFLQEVG